MYYLLFTNLPSQQALRFWGADIEAQNDDGLTALILAAQDGKFVVVKYLVEQVTSKQSLRIVLPLLYASLT